MKYKQLWTVESILGASQNGGLAAANDPGMTAVRELVEGEDELARWARERRDSGFFVSPSQQVQSVLAEISAYVVSNFEPQHAQTLLDGVDPWVIAQSKTDSSTVVTHE